MPTGPTPSDPETSERGVGRASQATVRVTHDQVLEALVRAHRARAATLEKWLVGRTRPD